MSRSNQRKAYLITLTTTDAVQRTAMRNALWRLGASEILPGLYLAYLTAAERQRLSHKFGVRIREQ